MVVNKPIDKKGTYSKIKENKVHPMDHLLVHISGYSYSFFRV
jgi:hypothetical protein